VRWFPDRKSLLVRKTHSPLYHDLDTLSLLTGDMEWITEHEGQAGYKNIHFNKDGDHIYLLSNKRREFFGIAFIQIKTKNFTWLKWIQPIFTRYSHIEGKMKFIRLANLNNKLASFFKRHTEFESITILGLRHTPASLLFEAGASIKDVQVRLGHNDIQTTMNIYTHVTNAAKEKVDHLFKNFMDF
jgi:hypothetical protein